MKSRLSLRTWRRRMPRGDLRAQRTRVRGRLGARRLFPRPGVCLSTDCWSSGATHSDELNKLRALAVCSRLPCRSVAGGRNRGAGPQGWESVSAEFPHPRRHRALHHCAALPLPFGHPRPINPIAFLPPGQWSFQTAPIAQQPQDPLGEDSKMSGPAASSPSPSICQFRISLPGAALGGRAPAPSLGEVTASNSQSWISKWAGPPSGRGNRTQEPKKGAPIDLGGRGKPWGHPSETPFPGVRSPLERHRETLSPGS